MLSDAQITKVLTVCPACLGDIIGLAGYKIEVPEEEHPGVAQMSIDAKLVLNELEVHPHCRNGRLVPSQRKQ